MARRTVPITPAVLRWAIEESGFHDSTIADRAKVQVDTLRSWLKGTAQPGPGDFTRISNALNRPRALFFLPEPPAAAAREADFRFPTDEKREHLTPPEFKYVRRAKRIQRVLSWAATELDRRVAELPAAGTSDDPAGIAAKVLTMIAAAHPTRYPSNATPAQFQHWWRAALEELGVIVMLLPMGPHSARGFALADDHAPLIGVNTTRLDYAPRIFTMLHELGHIVLRTSALSDNLGYRRMSRREDPVERWCEQFAAAVLLPWPKVSEYLEQRGWKGSRISDLALPGAVARQFGASLTATVLRFIEREVASWDLYKLVGKAADAGRGGGGGDGGRDRVRIRRDEYGSRATGLLTEAVARDLVSRREALSQLGLRDVEFDRLVQE